jgi:hypothetical protein
MSFLHDLQQMTGGLRELYQLRADFQNGVKSFMTFHNVWKASVLIDDHLTEEDDNAKEQRQRAWQELERLEGEIKSLQARLGITEKLVEMPVDAYNEVVVPLRAQERRKAKA